LFVAQQGQRLTVRATPSQNSHQTKNASCFAKFRLVYDSRKLEQSKNIQNPEQPPDQKTATDSRKQAGTRTQATSQDTGSFS
jgi:hypothetical protein